VIVSVGVTYSTRDPIYARHPERSVTCHKVGLMSLLRGSLFHSMEHQLRYG